MFLSEVIRVARRFQRSIRVDADLESVETLDSFICHESHSTAIQTMAKLILESDQRAFTWTGPYGGGKSSLALVLAGVVNRNSNHRKKAFAQLNKPKWLRNALPANQDNWLVIPVVGRRSNPVEDIRESLKISISAEPGKPHTKQRRADSTGTDVISRLEDEAKARPSGGVLLIIDEMGKFLEGARSDDIDIHFFQELAEHANRCEGRFIVIGILHQTFGQYASRLGLEIQDEWTKIQGRFIDIPITTAVDEVIELIGRAIVTDDNPTSGQQHCNAVAKTIAKRRPGTSLDMSEKLRRCWPLHPITAALIGPISRGKFAQNERSVFGFLCSEEPFGFQEFLRTTRVNESSLYRSDKLWDYLRSNLEPAIVASPVGHRWVQNAEVIERCEMRGLPLHIKLIKTIALIDLFGEGSGVMAERSILRSCRGKFKVSEVDKALTDMEDWSVIIFRKHLNSWAIYDGSDFDIQSAVETEKAKSLLIDLRKLGEVTSMAPLVAKKHYFDTGTLRWFESGLVVLSACESAVSNFIPSGGESGKFLLVMSSAQASRSEVEDICKKASRLSEDYPVAVGIPPRMWLLHELGVELGALLDVQRHSPELEGDVVARREISAWVTAKSFRFKEELKSELVGAEWYVDGEQVQTTDRMSLSKLVSKIAGDTYKSAPIIKNELINRIKPSSSGRAAVRRLIYCMVNNPDRENLGIDGFKAERGLYSSILARSGLHCKKSKVYKFEKPSKKHALGKSFVPMWEKGLNKLESSSEPLALSELYELWKAPPFGIREGLLPVLSMAFILAERESIAVYSQGMFRPDIDDFFCDQLLQDASQIQLLYVCISEQQKRFLDAIAKSVGNLTGNQIQETFLSISV